MSDLSFLDSLSLIPPADPVLSAAEDLADAEASALEDLGDVPPEAPPVPLGRSWAFDEVAGRFLRDGQAPKEVRGRDALAMWCMMAMRSARFAHRIFTADFGMEDPESPIGEAADVEEFASDWGERLRDALLLHDRIVGVENFDAEYDSDEGVLYVTSLDVVTDEPGEDVIRFNDIRIEV